MAAIARKRGVAECGVDIIGATTNGATQNGATPNGATPNGVNVVVGDDEASPRKLKRVKERRVYSEDLVDHDAINYIDGQRCFDIQGGWLWAILLSGAGL